MEKLVTTFSRQSSIKSAEDVEASKPPKPANRARALTLPLEAPQRVGLKRVKQKTVLQVDCVLFRLPLELRQQIYRIVLGGKCVAHDISGNRIGDRSDPWPPYERPGGERRGLRPWGWQPNRKTNILSLLVTCRQIYSESIDTLYANNIFYFRNPFTNWSLSSWRVLPQRLEQIRILILDETIGDTNIVFSNRRQWKRMWRVVAKMSRLKVLYLNVDTPYSKAWTRNRDFEKRLLSPLAGLSNVEDILVILRWLKPVDLDENEYPPHVRRHLWRQEEYDLLDNFYAACKPADMREWITKALVLLEEGAISNVRDSLLTLTE
ncbi:uncharacterized protein PV09_07022 [Verruconis gallopava]|uniref:DUF7730 domain-containing protein n=1 Tax=Verruconis gallopava TaxID=253628 RepID=A0A0D2AQV5_9PEZI|nr:uncharacterized protein PV09_07022 [Verruconis gallopava]KIW01544.1 hypothetical protein PV09_07022 [Verruconis gallopava]